MAKELLGRVDEDPGAEALLIELLMGRVPMARPIGRTVASSKRRDILLHSWASWLRQAYRTYFENREAFEPREVLAKARWIAKQAPRMRGVSEDAALEVLRAAAELAILVRQLPTGPEAENALVEALIPLQAFIPSFDAELVATAARSSRPFPDRARLLQNVDQRLARGDSLVARLRSWALREDQALAEYLFTSIRDRPETARKLAAQIRSGCDAAIAGGVIASLLEYTPEQDRTTYAEPILSLALQTERVTSGLLEVLVASVASTQRANRAPGALSAVLYDIHDGLAAEFQEQRKRERAEHEQELKIVQGEKLELEHEKRTLEELVERVKNSAREPEWQTEYRARAAVLAPFSQIYQELMTALRDAPDLRLDSIAKMVRLTLVRQGVVPVGRAGEIVPFDPALHQTAPSSSQGAGEVRIVAEGFLLKQEMLDEEDLLVPVLVEAIDEEG